MKSSPPPFVRELVCFQLHSFGEACLPSTATELGVTLTRTCLVLLLPAIALEMSWNDLIDNEDQMSRASISSSQRGHLHLLQPLPPVAVDSLERNMHALSTQTMAISDLMTSVVSGVAQGQRSRDHASAVRPTVSRRLHSMRALPPAPTSWMLQNINGRQDALIEKQRELLLEMEHQRAEIATLAQASTVHGQNVTAQKDVNMLPDDGGELIDAARAQTLNLYMSSSNCPGATPIPQDFRVSRRDVRVSAMRS